MDRNSLHGSAPCSPNQPAEKQRRANARIRDEPCFRRRSAHAFGSSVCSPYHVPSASPLSEL